MTKSDGGASKNFLWLAWCLISKRSLPLGVCLCFPRTNLFIKDCKIVKQNKCSWEKLKFKQKIQYCIYSIQLAMMQHVVMMQRFYFITDSPKRNACRSTQQSSKNNQPARWYVTPLQQSKCVTISRHKTLHYNLLSFNLSASSLSFSQLFIGWQKYNIRLAAFLTNVHMQWFGYDNAVLAPEVAMG